MKNLEDLKVVVVGGHLSPAKAIIEELLKRRIKKIFFLGRQRTSSEISSFSSEWRYCRKLKIPFYHLSGGKIPRFVSFDVGNLLNIPLGICQAFFYLQKIKPDMVIGFGGYLTFAVAVAAWFLRIPIFIHEQTQQMGLANSLAARISRGVFLAKDMGIPIRRSFFETSGVLDKILSRRKTIGLPVVLVLGGTIGSQNINAKIMEILPLILKDYFLIWQTGDSDFEYLRVLVSKMKMNLRERVLIDSFFEDRVVGGLIAMSNLVITRTGANIINELTFLPKTAILFPLPWSSGEQNLNAKNYQKKIASAVILTDDVSSDDLHNVIRSIGQTQHHSGLGLTADMAEIKEILEKGRPEKFPQEIMVDKILKKI